MLMLVPGYSEDGSFQVGERLVVLAISLVLSVALFLFAVPRGGVIARTVLGALAVARVLVFWAGITLPLAAAPGAVGGGYATTATPPRARSWCTCRLSLSALDRPELPHFVADGQEDGNREANPQDRLSQPGRFEIWRRMKGVADTK